MYSGTAAFLQAPAVRVVCSLTFVHMICALCLMFTLSVLYSLYIMRLHVHVVTDNKVYSFVKAFSVVASESWFFWLVWLSCSVRWIKKQGGHISWPWRSLKKSIHYSRTWKVLESRIGPWKFCKRCLKVLQIQYFIIVIIMQGKFCSQYLILDSV